MIKIKCDKTNQIEVIIQGKFQSSDFDELTKTMDQMIAKHGNIKVLANSVDFLGWDDLLTMQKHFNFVQNHHHRIDKLAVIMGAWWQSAMLGLAKIFVHPKVRSFEENEIDDAKKWLKD